MKNMNRRGQGLTEYLVLLFLVTVVSIGVISQLGGMIKQNMRQAKDTIERHLTLENSK